MKTAKLFGLVLVLGMMLLLVQYRLRRPPLSKISSLIQHVERQNQALMEQRRDPHHIFCRPPPSRRESNAKPFEATQTFVGNNSINDVNKESQNLDKNNVIDKDNENHNIVFVTGHRAGGTTVENIMFRFAMTRNLNVLLPINRTDSTNETHFYMNKTQILPVPRGQRYNILCQRTIYNKEVVSSFFPKSTFYIGILRHPLNQSASALYHYTQRQKVSKDENNVKYSLAFQASPSNPYRAFINKPHAYDVDNPSHSFTNNRQSIDLGFPVTSSFEDDKNDTSKILKFVGDVDKTFGLIMIGEMFDESLVLLRRLLHWKTEDILYTKLNANDKTDHISDVERLTEEDIKIHRKWENLDYALYEHFKSKLEGMILAQGEEFQLELQMFREIQVKVKNFCNMMKSSFRSLELRIKPNTWSPGFCITPSFCDFVSKEGNQMTDLIRRHQLENVKMLSSQ